MAKKLFVGGLPFAIDDDKLKELFAAFGAVASAVVIKDRDSGRSKGFGFVEFDDDAAADKAIAEMNGKDVEGRNITVNEARPQTDRPRGDGGGGRQNRW
jgi:cold-inducible RNA-binding protein